MEALVHRTLKSKKHHFLYDLYLNLLVQLLVTLNDLNLHDSVRSSTGHLESKILATELCRPPYYWHVSLQLSKKSSPLRRHWFLQKKLSNGKRSVHVKEHGSFSRISILPLNLNFISIKLSLNPVQCSPRSDTSFTMWEMSAEYLSLNSVCASCLSIKCIQDKVAGSASLTQSHTTIINHQAKCLMHTFHSHKALLKDQDQ